MKTSVLATWSYKGGVAKTTTCLNVAAALHSLGHSVAVIDQDEQETTVSLSQLGDGMPFPVLSSSKTGSPPVVDFLLLDYPPGYAGNLIAGQQDLLIVPIRPVWTDYEATMRGLASLSKEEKTLPLVSHFEKARGPHQVFLKKLQEKFGNEIIVVPKKSVIEDTQNFGMTVFSMPSKTYGVKEARQIYLSIAAQVKEKLEIK